MITEIGSQEDAEGLAVAALAEALAEAAEALAEAVAARDANLRTSRTDHSFNHRVV